MQIFLTEKDVAKQIKVSLASLRRWRLLQRGPRFIKVGALVRYRAEDLEQWLETLPAGGTATQRPPLPRWQDQSAFESPSAFRWQPHAGGFHFASAYRSHRGPSGLLCPRRVPP